MMKPRSRKGVFHRPFRPGDGAGGAAGKAIGKREIMKLAWKIARRDGVAIGAALTKAWAWAKKTNAAAPKTAAPSATPTIAESEAGACRAPYFCRCPACRTEQGAHVAARTRAASYRGGGYW